jgi:hypothetical protein
MVKFLAIVFALIFLPYLIISKSQQLKDERQAKVRYFLFIGIVAILILVLIRIL